uniref:Uncharacterized protein n=1 Tax=Anopheles culicifacies TaxID=139723 RepID=A0A182LZK7_9DIPT
MISNFWLYRKMEWTEYHCTGHMMHRSDKGVAHHHRLAWLHAHADSSRRKCTRRSYSVALGTTVNPLTYGRSWRPPGALPVRRASSFSEDPPHLLIKNQGVIMLGASTAIPLGASQEFDPPL